MGRSGQASKVRPPTFGVAGAATIPPLARRPVISPAMALREEINDSWRLLIGSLGAALVVAGALFTLASALG
jgi:hypothetical protein